MPIAESIKYVHEPTDLQCGQAVLAMLSGDSAYNVCKVVKTDRETKLTDMFSALDYYKIGYNKNRVAVTSKTQLPKCCILSLETPRCWHWSLYCDGVFYDPEHGVMDDFPVSNRKYYFEILQ